MKLITRDTDYAIRALCFISQQKKQIVSVSRLVKELGIPRPFLRKLLQVLNQERILKSYKGQGGGFVLAKAADRIQLADLMRVFQGPLELSECFLRKSACPNLNTCALRKKIKNLEAFIIKELGYVTIASLSGGKLSYGKKKNNQD